MKAAEQGVATAMSSVGDMYYAGDGVEENLEEAYKWYSKAEQLDDIVGSFLLNGMYRDGVVPSKFYKQEFKALKKIYKTKPQESHLMD